MNWDLRRLYGEVYALEFADGMQVPWRPLPYGEFIYYTDLLDEGRVPVAVIEDEVFQRAVTSSAMRALMDGMKAGRVTLVAQAIIAASGPRDIEDFNHRLESKRQVANTPLHQIPLIIQQAFPSYKLEDVYGMDYDTMLLRLAQAEYMLLKSGRITEPVSLYKDAPEKGRKPAPEDLKRKWEQSQQRAKEVAEFNARSSKEDRRKGIPTPPLEKPSREEMLQKRDKIDFTAENRELSMAGALDGHDLVDEALIKARALENMKKIYPHLFSGEKKG